MKNLWFPTVGALLFVAVGPGAAGPGAAGEPADPSGGTTEDLPALCARFHDHLMGISRQDESLAAKLDAMSEEERAKSRDDFVAGCLTTEDPAEIEVMRCGLGKTDMAGIQSCMEPQLAAMRLRAMLSEAPANLAGIRVAQIAHFAEHDAYRALPPNPAEIPGPDAVPFHATAQPEWASMGLGSFPTVRCRYSVVTAGPQGPLSGGFLARAECDIDGDGVIAVFEASADEKPRRVTDDDVF
jgi:hypothetical protein